MNKQYKALMLDVDGTLIVNHRTAIPTQNVIETIKQANKKIHVGIATARPITELKNIFKTVFLSGPSIINGGSQIIDLPSGEFLKEVPLEKDDVCRIVKKAKEYGFKEIIVNDGRKDFSFTDKSLSKKLFQVYLPALLENSTNDFLRDISHLSRTSAHKIVSWEKDSLDIVVTHSLATKHHGILEVARILNIDTSEIIGVGDGYNDFPLLMACGLKIAMGNAVDEIKEIADYIAPSVEKDGVAEVIRKFIL